MNQLNDRISYTKGTFVCKEELSKEIARRIINAGAYQIADELGVRINNFKDVPSGCVGILRLDPTETTERLFGFIPIKDEIRRPHIGTLYVDGMRGAVPNSFWVMEVYGRKNIPELTNLAKGFLLSKKDLRIQIDLKSEQEKLEKFYPDDF